MAKRRHKNEKNEKLKETTLSIATDSGSQATPGNKSSAEGITEKKKKEKYRSRLLYKF